MKLIKINTDHYVVVDETIQPVHGYYYDSFINKVKNTDGAEYGEAIHCWQITHSTMPLIIDFVTYRGTLRETKKSNLSLQEVKESFCWLDGTEWEVEIVDGKLKLKL